MKVECLIEKLEFDGVERVKGEVFNISPSLHHPIIDLIKKGMVKVYGFNTDDDEFTNRKLGKIDKKELN